MIDQVFNNAVFNEENPDCSVEIDVQQMEDLARILLSCSELRSEFANQVGSLTTQAKRGLENEDAGQWQ